MTEAKPKAIVAHFVARPRLDWSIPGILFCFGSGFGGSGRQADDVMRDPLNRLGQTDADGRLRIRRM